MNKVTVNQYAFGDLLQSVNSIEKKIQGIVDLVADI